MAQTVGIVSVFVSGDDLVDALPRQGQRIVAHTLRWRSRSAEYYLRWATVVLHCSSGNKDYNQGVRHYTTKRIKDGTMFICAHCEHRVTTLDFHREAGTPSHASGDSNQSALCRSAWPTYGGFINRFAAAYLA